VILAVQLVTRLLEDEEDFDPKAEAGRMFTAGLNTCPECGADYRNLGAVNRRYCCKWEGPDITCAGHYDNEGTFDPDERVDSDLVGYDLLDDSDTCSNCDTPVPTF